MKVSVIVVSHNVSKFLPRALSALVKATAHLDAEIITIDDGFDDNTITSIRSNYPSMRIASLDGAHNEVKAVNHGIQLATGEYILLVKPDTIVQPDTIEKALAFMNQHVQAGGMGVRMLDADGNYLQSSKKVLPKAWISFFKLTGVLKQFPKSRLGDNFTAHHEDEFDTTETDVLGCKFMLLRRSVLENIGLFDERFANYGSEIDLSYRIRLAGFKNYYFPKTYVIDSHAEKLSLFKWRHIRGFYGAMFTFVLKYFFRLPAIHVKQVQALFPAYELKG